MTRRTLYRIAPLACLLLAGLSRPLPGAEPPPRVNVVFLLSDDQRWTDYGFMGHPHIETPRLDSLSRQSRTFTRGYVPTSLCRPSLATMVTGLYPHQHRIVGNDPAFPRGVNAHRARIDPTAPGHDLYQSLMANINQHPNLPTLLRDAGYLTYQCGKWWEGDPRKTGFTHAMSHGDPKRDGRHGDVGLEIGRKGIAPVIEFLDEAQKAAKPFFLWYAPMLPHEPHNPPPDYLVRYRDATTETARARYWAMCEWLDFTCGQVLDELDRRGLADNTLVVYVCDNGWNPPVGPDTNDGGGVGSARAKRSPYEAGVRTPIMFRFPRRISPALDNRTLASSIDLLPTILSACGIDPPPNLPGLNLLDPAARSARDTLFGEIHEHDVADLADPAASLRFRWVIDGRHKLIAPSILLPEVGPELYDLYADPFERRNLAAADPARVAALRTKLDAWWTP